MSNGTVYPMMEINVRQIQENAKKVVKLCKDAGIEVCGVVKSTEDYAHGYKNVADAFLQGGCTAVGDSRLNTILRMRELGIHAPILLLRLPMLSEIEQVVRATDISLNSERRTLDALYQEAQRQKKIHKVILMVDLGDLREGYFDEEELLADALYLETQLKASSSKQTADSQAQRSVSLVEGDTNAKEKGSVMDPAAEDSSGGLHFLGIGTNLGCYGAIKPDTVNLGRLVSLAQRIEEKIGRKLEVVSGGATSTLPLVLNATIPKGITHLRIGEGILLNRDLPDIWGVSLGDLYNTNYVLHAQVIEVKEKASHPIGEVFIDAFGNRPTYEDKGRRRRALLALGKRDIGAHSSIVPRLPGVSIEGGSSDHLILDVTDCKQVIQVGDILSFDAYYLAMVHANQSSCVQKVYVEEGE